MKTRISKVGSLFLILFLVASACEEDKNRYDSDSIIGKWEWIYSSGGFVGSNYPEGDQTCSLEFTIDSMLIEKDKGVTIFESPYVISGDTLRYYRGTNLEYIIELANDTLGLYFIVEGIDNFYKRIR